MDLKGRTAVVTGSTSGIGHAIASALAGAGAGVMINGIESQAEGDAVARELADANGVDARYSGADMSRPEEVTGLIDETLATFGSVDIVVNNAGIQHTAPVEAFPVEKWDAIQSIMLGSAFHTIRRAIPHMQRAGWGRIINTASAHGLVASVNKAAYVSAKHGLVGLTKTVTDLHDASETPARYDIGL